MNSRFLQDHLENLLKVEFKVQGIKDEASEMLVEEEKKTFCTLLNNIEQLQEDEDKIFDAYGIDLESLVEPYWGVIENLIDFTYNSETADLIRWYLHERKGPTGEIYGWVDKDGTSYKFNGPEDLFEFIMYKYEDRD